MNFIGSTPWDMIFLALFGVLPQCQKMKATETLYYSLIINLNIFGIFPFLSTLTYLTPSLFPSLLEKEMRE